MRERLLLVDDEPNLLAGLKRVLYPDFDITVAAGGPAGLEAIAKQGPFAVVVSDFRMPEMNGVQFLTRARAQAPDTVRVLFTGHADLKSAMDAINEGNIFRLLLKPSTPSQLSATLKTCVEQHRLITAEKTLLEKTLRGAVSVLADILSAVSPVAFSKSSRVKELCLKLAPALELEGLWQLEVTALLSQIGCVTLPPGILEKKLSGAPLKPDEQRLYAAHPDVGARLLHSIPRLEAIREAIALQDAPFDNRAVPVAGMPTGEKLPKEARILKVALDYDALLSAGKGPADAWAAMASEAWKYDQKVLGELERLVNRSQVPLGLQHMPVDKLRPGMILADDLRDRNGLMLIAKGHKLTNVLVYKLSAFRDAGVIGDTLLVFDQESAPAPDAGP